MLGIIRRAYGGFGAMGGAFSAASWQDDAQAWAEWAKMNPVLAGALMGAGGVMFATWLVWEGIALGRWMGRRRAESALARAQPATEDDEVDEGAVARDAWRISPAAGLLAAEAIQKAANIDEARRIFRAFQAQQSRRDVNEVYEAYTARLKHEGLGDTQEAFDVGWDEAEEEE